MKQKSVKKLFKMTEKQLKIYLHNHLLAKGYTPVNRDGFLYAKGTHPVLLVAHLDTVHTKPVQTICTTHDGKIWMSPEGIGGDDRCGVYMILKIIEEFDCSVLFCEQEEIGGVGATAFASSGIIPDASYIVEFDRRGATDAVFYDCANDDFEKFILSAGYKNEYGTFSDISIIAPAVGIAAVNLSSGFYNAHTQHEYVNFKHVEKSIEMAKSLIAQKTEKYEYIEDLTSYGSGYRYGHWSEYGGSSYGGYGAYGGYGGHGYSGWYEDLLCRFDGYIVNNSLKSELRENLVDGTYLTDKYGDVYEYMPDGIAVWLEDWEAKTYDFGPIKFDSKSAAVYECMDEETYLEIGLAPDEPEEES